MPLVALREAALAAVAARLSAQMPDVVVERARRAPVDVEVETLPRLVLLGGALTADAQVEPGSIHYGVEFSVAGWVAAATDLAAEQALSALHARVVEALVRWTPEAAHLLDPEEQQTDFEVFDIEASARPAGAFVARFALRAIAPGANPWSPT